MLNVSLIRTSILLLTEPGPRAEYVIRAIVAEAERYAKECARLPEAEIRARVAEVRRAIREIGKEAHDDR